MSGQEREKMLNTTERALEYFFSNVLLHSMNRNERNTPVVESEPRIYYSKKANHILTLLERKPWPLKQLL